MLEGVVVRLWHGGKRRPAVVLRDLVNAYHVFFATSVVRRNPRAVTIKRGTDRAAMMGLKKTTFFYADSGEIAFVRADVVENADRLGRAPADVLNELGRLLGTPDPG